jgi:hypothetical protein
MRLILRCPAKRGLEGRTHEVDLRAAFAASTKWLRRDKAGSS